MGLIQKANKLGYKHYTEFTVEELDNLSLGNSNKQIEYYFIQKWLREIHNIHIQIELEPGITSKTNQFQTYLYDLQNYDNNIRLSYYNLYEEALETGLQEALKLI